MPVLVFNMRTDRLEPIKITDKMIDAAIAAGLSRFFLFNSRARVADAIRAALEAA